tara:strand:- start:7113 stop:7649 length:537 start_codon:yes stop_codon:yes gene_type:complete
MIEPESFSDVDKDIMSIFFKHTIFAFKKYEEREYAIINLKDHLKKLKKIASKKEHKKDFSEQLAELEDKIAIALEKERTIIKHVFDDETYNSKLHSRIELLDNKLGKYLDGRKLRSKRVKELEQKIKGDSLGSEDTSVSKRLIALENKLKRLSKHKRANKVKIQMLQGKIDMMKTQVS